MGHETRTREGVGFSGAVLADSAVESGVVGYSTTSLEANKWYLVGTQFKGVADSNDEISICDLVKLSGVAGVPFSQRTTKAAQIQYWTGSGYAYFYYISDATGQSGDCWASGKTLATRKIPVGAGFWFKTPETIDSGAIASFAGAVISSDTAKDIDVGGTQWVMVSNPFPVPLTGNMITTSGLVASTFAKRTTDAPQMQVWTGAGYKYYYYISDATGQSEDCWASGKTRVTTAVLADVGQAFWVKSSSAGTLSFNINP